MRTLLILALSLQLLPAANLTQTASQDSPGVAVLEFKWTRYRRDAIRSDIADPATNPSSQRTMVDEQNRALPPEQRSNREVRTVEEQSKALKQAELNAEFDAANQGRFEYVYNAKIKNVDARAIKSLIWEYQFFDTSRSGQIGRRQFICSINIKPDETKTLRVTTLLSPPNVVSAASLSDKSKKPFDEKVVINRIEFQDGTVWERDGWSISFSGGRTIADITKQIRSNTCHGL